jgi:FKBP-type peptidyl-prolyl cis-trans isomerase
VVVPPALGYGARGYQAVGPNAVLIYVIELAGIV